MQTFIIGTAQTFTLDVNYCTKWKLDLFPDVVPEVCAVCKEPPRVTQYQKNDLT